MAYKNPIISGFHPDPSICRSGDDYFLVTSSFEYFPGVPLFHSRDLVHWRQIGHCLTRESQLELRNLPSSKGIYAPTIRCYRNRFYMTTTNVGGKGNFIVWSDDPFGEWSDPIWIDQPGIDPDLYFSADESVYFSTSGGGADTGIYQSRIDIHTGERLTEYKVIWKGTGGAYPEAPHIYKINGRYYLMIAEGGTEYGHMVTIAVGDHPSGPFSACPDNPILSHRSLDHPIQATGHADLVQLPGGEWWMVCLGVRPVGYPKRHHLGRETFLAPVNFNNEGWLKVGTSGLISEAGEAPALPPCVWEDEESMEDFTGSTLGLVWNSLRNPPAEQISLKEHPGYLTLRGTPASLDDCDSPSFVGRRQQHFRVTAAAMLKFEPLGDGEEAGLTVFMNERFHYEIALTRRNGERRLIFRRRLGSLSSIESSVPWPYNTVELGVEANTELYRFTARGNQASTPLQMGQGECSLLATEVAGGFTGVYFGLYATGNGAYSKAPALVEWFSYVPVKDVDEKGAQ